MKYGAKFLIKSLVLLLSIQISASQRSCSQKCLAIKSPACMDAACLSLACLATAATTLGSSVYAAQSLVMCLQVAPIKECVCGTGVACVCGYLTVGVASELTSYFPEGARSLCCKSSRNNSEMVAQMPVQQTMGREGSKLE